MSVKNLLSSWNDIKIYVLLIVILVILGMIVEPYFIPVGIALLAFVYYFSNRKLKDKEIVLTDYLDNITRNIERANHFAVRNLDVGMAVFSKDGKLQWKNETFQKIVETKALEGKRPEEILPELGENAFETLSVRDGSKIIRLEDKYYNVKYFSIKTLEKFEKNRDITQQKNGLMLFFTDVTEHELLKEKFENERLCLAYVRFDNYEDVMKGMSETARANIEGEVADAINKWVESQNGFACRASKESILVGFNDSALKDMMQEKFTILEKVRDISSDNKIAPTLSIGVASNGNNFQELSLNASKALDLALGRGGDQVVVFVNDEIEFFGGTTTVSAKSTRVRARMVAKTIREQMLSSDRVFIMGHSMEDYDSIGSAIGVAKMSRSLKKETYIVVSGKGFSINKINEILTRGEILIGEDSDYIDMMIEEEKAMSLVTDDSLIMIVDHHRASLSASPKVLDAISRRIIIDHHRRSGDLIPNAVLQYLEPSSSSTCELVTELTSYFDDKIEFTIGEATALYAGIVVDTKNFAVQTGERTFDAAATLRRAGADPNLVRQLFKDDMEAFKLRAELIAAATTPIPGVAVAISKEAKKSAEMSIISAQTADSLININGIKVGVVVTEYDDDSIGVSARSDGSVNVQLIMEELGGGGHQTVAGVQLQNMRANDILPQIIEMTKKQLEEVEEREKHESNLIARG